jgi:quercetin dioxygenase-like cupin family protein
MVGMNQKTLFALVGFIIGLSVSFFLPKKDLLNTTEMEKLPEPYYSVLWENEYIRVVEHTMAPGDSEPMHAHPEMLAYVMERSDLLITEEDGTTNKIELNKGDFQQLPSWTHSIRNVGDTHLHTLLVELKR